MFYLEYYLFYRLPLFLPKSFITSIDPAIRSSIWAGKPLRIQKKILQRLKQDGGFAIPNMLFYYCAANI